MWRSFGSTLLAHQLDVVHRQIVRDRAELVEHHQVADVQTLDDVLELLGDLAGRAGHDVAVGEQILPGQERRALAEAGGLRRAAPS